MRKLTGMTGAVSALLLILGWGGSAQAQFLLTGMGGSGGQLQIGTGLPLPVGVAGIYLGGMIPATAGTPFWPPLNVPPNPNISTGGGATRTIMQTLGTAHPSCPPVVGCGGAIVIPPAALSTPAPGPPPVGIGVFPTNPAVFQVATSISYAWPAAAGTVMGGTMTSTFIPGTVTLAPGGAPGPLVTGTALVGGIISYGGGTKAFGGPGVFALAPGPGAGTARAAPNTMGIVPIATVWINLFGALPATAMTVLVVGASAPPTVMGLQALAAPGAALAALAGTTMFGALALPFGAVNVPVGGGGCTMYCMGPAGTIPSSASGPGPALSNMVTGSKGFPWSTGFVTISQPGAGPPEVFFQSGTDMRVAGVGNVSLVSGSLSARALSGPNANRGWLSLTLAVPEPTAALGAVGALAMLGLCHGLVRRRSR